MYDDLCVGDVVKLKFTGQIVRVTDVPETYEGMTETLFVYTPEIELGRESHKIAITDRSLIEESYGPFISVVR